MKTKETKLQKCLAGLLRLGRMIWMILGKSSPRHSRTGAARPDAVPKEPAAARLNPLDRITEHLRHLGLGQSVSVHLEVAGTGFVLEDADGLVHAKDYDQAVTIIERIWLYQP